MRKIEHLTMPTCPTDQTLTLANGCQKTSAIVDCPIVQLGYTQIVTQDSNNTHANKCISTSSLVTNQVPTCPTNYTISPGAGIFSSIPVNTCYTASTCPRLTTLSNGQCKYPLNIMAGTAPTCPAGLTLASDTSATGSNAYCV